MKIIICLYCGNSREMPDCKRDRKFCKQEHYWLYKKGQTSPRKGIKFTEEMKRTSSVAHMGQKSWNKGKKYTIKEKEKMNMEGLKKGRGLFKGTHRQTNTGITHFKKGHKSWHDGKKGLVLNTGKTWLKKGHISWNKGKISPQLRGQNNGNWRGGTTPLGQKIRSSLEYEEWRKAIFERDLYTCQICYEVGGKLNADHIKPFSLFPELRLELSNGRTLCESCHRKTMSYLNPYMKKEDFLDE